MTDTTNAVVDSRLLEALEGYFNGVRLDRTIGDCTILTAIRKQNGAPVDIYTPSHAASRDDGVVDAMARDFASYDRLGHVRLQAPERLLTSRGFRKSPALALLSCPVAVFDDAFDLHPVDYRLRVLDEIMDGLAALHGAGLVHGNISDRAIRREDSDGGLKLCDFTFAGGRPTVVTAQPTAFQTCHVVNTAQPRPEDDIHALGMLGYRILLGRGGEARVLTGRDAEDDPDRLIAAVLGQATDAPDAAMLFPDGHKSGAQIARLLARMTGRLANAAPYSSAGAAHRALRSVLANPQAGGVDDTPLPALPARGDAGPAVAAAAVRAGGVSRGTALALFAGFLASTAAAVWFYLESDRTRSELVDLRTRAAGAVEAARAEAAEAAGLVAELERAQALTTQALDAADAAGTEAAERVAALAADLAASAAERDAAREQTRTLAAAGEDAARRIDDLEAAALDRETTMAALAAERDQIVARARAEAEAAADEIARLQAMSADRDAALQAALAEGDRAVAVLAALQAAWAGCAMPTAP